MHKTIPQPTKLPTSKLLQILLQEILLTQTTTVCATILEPDRAKDKVGILLTKTRMEYVITGSMLGIDQETTARTDKEINTGTAREINAGMAMDKEMDVEIVARDKNRTP
jgi:hypothetical protein